MTNEQAIRALHYVRESFALDVDSYEALNMAIEALNFVSEHHQSNIETYAHDMGVSLEQAERELRVEELSCSEKPNRSDLVKESSNLVKNLVKDTIYRQDAKDRLTILVNEIEGIFADIRERNVDDSVCGLCEYDCDHGIDGSAFECLGFERDDCFKLKDEYREEWTDVKALPSAQPDIARDIATIIENEKDMRVILNAPSAQSEIIRCKDCMHNGSFDTDCPIDWNGKEYCSFAERKEDE